MFALTPILAAVDMACMPILFESPRCMLVPLLLLLPLKVYFFLGYDAIRNSRI